MKETIQKTFSIKQKNKRLYVLVDKSLSPVYGCVQGGHAVAEYCLKNKLEWKNEYLIYLYADINKWMKKLDKHQIKYTAFREPDLNNKVTAIACYHPNGKMLFKSLKLVR